HLANGRHAAPRDLAAFALHHRDRAPAQHPLSFLTNDLFKAGFAGTAALGIEREKHLSHPVGARLGKFEAAAGCLTLEKLVRNLNQYSGAVAGARIAAARAAMGEIVEDLQCLAHDVVRALAGHVHDEPDAAGVVLVCRIVQSLGPRNSAALVHGSTFASSQ